MVKVVTSTVVDAPVEAVWEVLRDFNGHDRWHPIVRDSHVERGLPSDKVGCVRNFHLQDGSNLRELLLTLSDADMAAVLTYVRSAWGNRAGRVAELDVQRLRGASAR
jgi:hypothetical protein